MAEDFGQRFAAVDETLRSSQQSQHSKSTSLEEGLAALQQQTEEAASALQTLQLQLAQKAEGSPELVAAQMDEVVQMLEKNIAGLDKRLCSQVEELSAGLASLRVKVDGGHRRLTSLAERLEVNQQSASEGCREELLLLCEQDRRENDLRFASLKEQMRQVADESMQGIQGLCAAHQELARRATSTFEADAWRAIEESVNAHAQELATLFVDVADLQAFAQPLAHAGLSGSVVEQLANVEDTFQELSCSKARLQALEDWKLQQTTSMDQ
eukprot:4195808-Amphidinium_carterae.1